MIKSIHRSNSLRTLLFILFSLTLVLSVYCSRPKQQSQGITELKAELILIPGGEFVMGKNGNGDYRPAHKIYLDSFYMDKYEVTNAQYFKFCQDTERKLPEFWGMKKYHCGPDFPNHPVVGISWSDAKAYAEWADKRLPTEAEWEYAARGGLVGMNYSNGDELDTAEANYFVKDKTKGTVVVGSYPPNGYGLHDMAGNVWEWVSDYYEGEFYKNCPYKNPTGPEEGRFKVIRGGSWHSGPYCNRIYYRNTLPGNWVDFAGGFRCVKDLH